ncbi:glutathione S-transferase [Saccharospirillum impatiens]|uniref:glutathione S-transferase n=1 Tax=Saccharospirillum impatiens TaxID=169438 RepID=UPI00041F63C2|nr:glutathione S-transferase [Saccharospirillum impatiens]
MLTVHHLEKSRSHRVLWLLEELGLEYALKTYQRHPRTFLAPAELKAVHPLGKSPVITRDDMTLAESGAILEWLTETYPDAELAVAAADPARPDYLYWLHYAEGTLMPLLVMTLVFRRVPKSRMPFFAKPVAKSITRRVIGSYIQPQVDTQLRVLDDHLQRNTWLVANRFTCADIQISYPLEAAAGRYGLGEQYPALTAYLQRLRERPACQRAIDKGGPVTL